MVLWKRGLGINGLMRTFFGKENFSEKWDEDLDETISVFDTITAMCEMDGEEKFVGITGNDLR